MTREEVRDLIAILVGVLLISHIFVLVMLRRLYHRLESEHRRATYVNTVRGLIMSLKLGMNEGIILKVLEAIDDQFYRYDSELAEKEDKNAVRN